MTKIVLLIAAFFILISNSFVNAQSITLKRTFLAYSYSNDGINYQSIGNSASNLRRFMGEDEECRSLLHNYSLMHSLSYMTGFPGVIITSWALLINSGIIESENVTLKKNTLPLLLTTGLILTGAAIVLDILATSSLNAAVEKYNNALRRGQHNLSLNFSLNPGLKQLQINLNYSFY